MVQWFSTLAVLIEDLGLVPSTHIGSSRGLLAKAFEYIHNTYIHTHTLT